MTACALGVCRSCAVRFHWADIAGLHGFCLFNIWIVVTLHVVIIILSEFVTGFQCMAAQPESKLFQ